MNQRPNSLSMESRRQHTRCRSHRDFSNGRSCSLPTIAENKSTCFELTVSSEGHRAQSCHSLGLTASPRSKKLKRKSWNVPTRDDRTNAQFAMSSSYTQIDLYLSSPSPNTALSLLQDLHLSEAKKVSLAKSIRKQQPKGNATNVVDSILSPPQRTSSNVQAGTKQACAQPDSDLLHDRFASTLSTPTVNNNTKRDNGNPTSTRHQLHLLAVNPPLKPKRQASPVRNRSN
jgi:hypothetical protein